MLILLISQYYRDCTHPFINLIYSNILKIPERKLYELHSIIVQ